MNSCLISLLTILIALLSHVKVRYKKYSMKILFLGMFLTILNWIDLNTSNLSEVVFIKGFIACIYMVIWGICYDYLKYKKYELFEFFSICLILFIGIILIFESKSFHILYFGMEICRYSFLFLVLYKKNSEKTDSKSLNLLLTELLSSALFVFGLSIVYIQVGGLTFTSYHNLSQNDILCFAEILIFISFLQKIGGLPFGNILIERVSLMPTCLLSMECSIIQPVFLIVFSKIFFVMFDMNKCAMVFNIVGFMYLLYSSIQIFTQNNLRRMTGILLTYSQGLFFILLGTQNYKIVLLYCVFQAIIFIGFTTLQASLRYEGKTLENISDLNGLGIKNFLMGAVWGIILLGMVAVPPFGSFWIYFLILKTLIFQDRLYLVISLILFSLPCIYTFIKILKQMYIGKSKEYDFKMTFFYKLIFLFIVISNILMPLFINYFDNIVELEFL